jgi:hypothetical protein
MMARKLLLCAMTVPLLAGCSSSPYAPINQTAPVRAMDSFFSNGRTDYERPAPRGDYGYGYGRNYEQAPYAPRY